MIYFKSYAADRGSVVAMCDKELIGRVLRGGKLVLDLDKYAAFYKGELLSEDAASERLCEERICTANIVGERSVKVAVGCGLVRAEEVLSVEGVPFVQVYLIA